MKGKLINGKFTIRGINIFGLIITTKKALENINISGDELIISEEQTAKSKEIRK